MLDQVLGIFNILPDFDMDIMRHNQDLFETTTTIITGLRKIVEQVKPDIVLVHGDTTTSMAAALAAFYSHVPVGHVEAGLRTHNMFSPFPEEMNRQIVGRLSSYHFVPTEISKRNLLKENVPTENIYITGNTAIDSLMLVLDTARKKSFPLSVRSTLGFLTSDNTSRFILVTAHRRESFGQGFENICNGILDAARAYSDVKFVYPVHLNPKVRDPVTRLLSGRENIYLLDPLDYLSFVKLMDLSYFVLTDSGGIQEEAPALGKPVLVMRDTTERSEAVDAGTVRLVGTSRESIFANIVNLIESPDLYLEMACSKNPSGNGNASKIMRRVFEEKLA